jgi:hypothetical protein
MFRQLLRNAKKRARLFMSERGRRAGVLRGPGRVGSSSLFVPGFRREYGEREARDVKLLKEWLSHEQFAQYDAKSYFEVIGCHSGKQFRISQSISMNVHELDGAGRPRVGWCFAPKGSLAAGDVMLAQKIALETDERGALAVANSFPFKVIVEPAGVALRPIGPLRWWLQQGPPQDHGSDREIDH